MIHLVGHVWPVNNYVGERIPDKIKPEECSGFIFKYGSLGRARTADLVINSHPLYQLSYQGIKERVCY